jgi:hypothetical protein
LSVRLDPPLHPDRRHVALGGLFLVHLVKGSTVQVHADNTLVDELGPDQALGADLVQVAVRSTATAHTTS